MTKGDLIKALEPFDAEDRKMDKNQLDEAIKLLRDAETWMSLQVVIPNLKEDVEKALALLKSAKAEPISLNVDEMPDHPVTPLEYAEAVEKANKHLREEIEKLKSQLFGEKTCYEGKRKIALDLADDYEKSRNEIAYLTAENKRLNKWPDYFAWEREMEKVQAENAKLKEQLANRECFADGQVFCGYPQETMNALVAKRDKLTAENKRLAERIVELEKRPDFTKGEHDVSEFYPDEDEQALTERIEKLEKSKGNCIGCGEPIDHEYCQRCREQWAS